MSKDKIITFLDESNKIESVYDQGSLKQAKKAWDYLIKKKKLTVKTILKTHAILAHNKLAPEETGAFRKRPVWIGGHEAKPWYVVPELMDSWIKKANMIFILPKVGITQDILEDHIAFEAIHPFIDSNGRIGRILLNWQRVKVELPILVIYEKEKFQNYYPLFNLDKDNIV